MFRDFKEAVDRQWEKMKSHQLFRTQVEKELMWKAYLEAFPPGTNPLYKERTEHDCQACKSFIRAVGSMVAWIDEELVSIWDCEVGEPYTNVAAALSELVKEAPIKNVLLHDMQNVGVDQNHQDADGTVLTWEHFHVELPAELVRGDRGSIYAAAQSQKDVFARALDEITLDAIETTVELIEQGSLYRGEEFLHAVQGFAKLKNEWENKEWSERGREMFVWRQDHPAVTRIRNSAIGTLLVDLSEGKSLNAAVGSFEAKVAPQNYQRPKALVTKAMIERARKKVEELGYGQSLGRRFAVLEDVGINDVLFANRDARVAMNADPFDELIAEARDDTRALDKVEEVPIEKFLADVLPKATAIELMLENRHMGNLMSLVAPEDADAPSILKWSNNFTWSYKGELADSIRERVKARGGSVTGDFRASLAWFNSDDLDLHMVEPGPRGGRLTGEHIHFGHKRSWHTGGELDVDMNVNPSGPHASRNAVENITYPQRSRMLEGTYALYVHQYTHRESKDVGFEVEIEFAGETFTLTYDKEVRPSQKVRVMGFEFTHKEGMKILESLPRQDISKTVWGLPTQKFHPVEVVMLSPNHWNGRPVGNKHFLFMLQGCVREGSSRGFFNEQLSDKLREHRKVFECLGGKMRTENEGPQLSGLGFSSTRRNSVFARVSGSFNRTVKITF